MRNDYLIKTDVERNALSIVSITEEYISKSSGGYHIVAHSNHLSGKRLSDDLMDKLKEEVPEEHVVLIVTKKMAEKLRL